MDGCQIIASTNIALSAVLNNGINQPEESFFTGGFIRSTSPSPSKYFVNEFPTDIELPMLVSVSGWRVRLQETPRPLAEAS